MSSPTSPMVSNPTNKVGSTIVLKSLSILLGLFFIFIGAMKISPYLSKELHKDLRKEYVKYAKVFPLSSIFDFKIPSKWYRRIVGALEVVCGLAMALIPSHKIKNAANISLLLLMFLAVYSHYMVSDPFERSGPALVFTFMLGGRLVVWYQTEITQFYDLLIDEFFVSKETSKREADLAEAAQIQANGGVKQD